MKDSEDHQSPGFDDVIDEVRKTMQPDATDVTTDPRELLRGTRRPLNGTIDFAEESEFQAAT